MRPIDFTRATGVTEAITTVASDPASAFLAGGTTEIDLLRLGVARPDRLVDINRLPLDAIEELPDGGLRIGALVRMSDAARAPEVLERYPAVSQALLLGASQQLRNMASIGGNLCQRVRCAYFRDGVSPCNKREPDSGCSALEGLNRSHAILGTSGHCIATHPSDLAVALVALEAVVQTRGPDGSRAIPMAEFHRPPADTPQLDHILAHGELITAVDLPPLELARRSLYVKYRDRQSYEFALVSVAAALDVEDGAVSDVRLALGGVGTRPWRARRAEAELLAAPANAASFTRAAAVELAQAAPRRDNAFKLRLAQRAIVRALSHAMEAR